jgi:hypothetical protein
MSGAITPAPLYACLHGVHRHYFTFSYRLFLFLILICLFSTANHILAQLRVKHRVPSHIKNSETQFLVVMDTGFARKLSTHPVK